ncbi:MAG: hypothetical protein KDI92_09105 [Xanthomonadales bacterium]|nr:hypothetical protein [Xanthomonadales bacterium]
MKKLVTFILLIWVVALQASDNDKRPSWSQGLPEKKDAPEFNKPDFEMDTLEIERPTFDTDLIKPQVEYSEDVEVVVSKSADTSQKQSDIVAQEVLLPSSNQQGGTSEVADKVNENIVQTESVVEEQKHVVETAKTVASDSQEPNYNEVESISEKSESLINPENKFYNWEITRQLPIEVSSRILDKQSSVLLKIFINAKGDVIAVEPVLNDTPQSLVNLAERSIKRWKFVSPQSLGFKQQVLSRVFKVALSEKS